MQPTYTDAAELLDSGTGHLLISVWNYARLHMMTLHLYAI